MLEHPLCASGPGRTWRSRRSSRHPDPADRAVLRSLAVAVRPLGPPSEAVSPRGPRRVGPGRVSLVLPHFRYWWRSPRTRRFRTGEAEGAERGLWPLGHDDGDVARIADRIQG